MASGWLPSGWQLECTAVRQRTAQLLDCSVWCDCWFAVGPRGALRAAHGALLAAASPVLADMVFGAEREYGENIPMPDVEPDTFDIILKYIYTDEVHISSCRVAQGLYQGAHKLALPHLRQMCASYLRSHMEPGSACRTHELARQAGDDELADACLQMMRERTLEVMAAGSWLEAREETVARLFALEPLHIESELQLLAAAERRAGGSAPALEGSAPPLRRAVRRIRFLTLTPQEFANYPTPSTLLTETETLALHMNIVTMDAPVRMPSGFSMSRTPRNYDKSRPEAMVEIEVDISNLTTFHSDTFYVRDLRWRVKIERYSFYDSHFLGVAIQCNWERADSRWSCLTEADLQLHSYVPDRPSYSKKFNQWFTPKSYERCLPFIEWSDLMDPVNGYVWDNNIVLKVIVKAESSQQP